MARPRTVLSPALPQAPRAPRKPASTSPESSPWRPRTGLAFRCRRTEAHGASVYTDDLHEAERLQADLAWQGIGAMVEWLNRSAYSPIPSEPEQLAAMWETLGMEP